MKFKLRNRRKRKDRKKAKIGEINQGKFLIQTHLKVLHTYICNANTSVAINHQFCKKTEIKIG